MRVTSATIVPLGLCVHVKYCHSIRMRDCGAEYCQYRTRVAVSVTNPPAQCGDYGQNPPCMGGGLRPAVDGNRLVMMMMNFG